MCVCVCVCVCGGGGGGSNVLKRYSCCPSPHPPSRPLPLFHSLNLLPVSDATVAAALSRKFASLLRCTHCMHQDLLWKTELRDTKALSHDDVASR